MINALIVDDEPHNIEWIADYIRYCKGVVNIVNNEEDACKYLKLTPDCNLLIIDIRIGRTLQTTDSVTLSDANPDWGGLYVANYARVVLNRGLKKLKIAAYTVVKDDDLTTRLRSLQVKYLQKGQIMELREFIKKME